MPDRTCRINGCTNHIKVKARQLCNTHYIRMQRSGELEPLPKIDQFALRVAQGPDCWIWQGRVDEGGYGKLGARSAHRLAWTREHGPIPDGMTIDHRCRVRACVRPSHLRLMTPAANYSDNGFRDRTHCKNGHEWSEQNTKVRVRNGRSVRVCRACNRIAVQRYNDRKKQRP